MNQTRRGRPGRRLGRAALAWAACALVAGSAAVWAGHAAWAAFESRQTPSCSWPMRIRGAPTAAEAGLVRCYLRALARRDMAGLAAVADNMPPVRVTRADLAHSADARSGLATATFLPADVDIAFIPLTIRYADGAGDRLALQNLAAMGGPWTWRMTIGTEAGPGPPGPAPATAAPPPAPNPLASPAHRHTGRPGN